MKKFFSKSALILSLTAFTPFVVFAQGISPTCDTRGGLYDFLCRIHGLLGVVVPLLIALGVVYLVWGIVQYVIADSEEAKNTGRDRIIFGVIGLAVIVSIWGLVLMVVNTFGGTDLYAPPGSEFQKLIPQKS